MNTDIIFRTALVYSQWTDGKEDWDKVLRAMHADLWDLAEEYGVDLAWKEDCDE